MKTFLFLTLFSTLAFADQLRAINMSTIISGDFDKEATLALVAANPNLNYINSFVTFRVRTPPQRLFQESPYKSDFALTNVFSGPTAHPEDFAFFAPQELEDKPVPCYLKFATGYTVIGQAFLQNGIVTVIYKDQKGLGRIARLPFAQVKLQTTDRDNLRIMANINNRVGCDRLFSIPTQQIN